MKNTAKSYYKNNKLCSSYFSFNNIKQEKCKWFYDNGSIKIISHKDNKINGVIESFNHKTSIRHYISINKIGILNGIYINFNY